VEPCKGRVLIVDDDEVIAALVIEVLSEEGYASSVLKDARTEAIQETVTRLEPDCILLDGSAGHGYGESWDTAAVMASRLPPVPVIMFTAHSGAASEAVANTSARSRAARFTSLLPKPFSIDELIGAVDLAVGRSVCPGEARGR
jgi:CheY-like chemotaxis protein